MFGLWHVPLKAEAFGNSSLTIPRVGMAFFDAPVLYHKKPWGLNHQWTFGSSFMQALNYRWWWIVDTSLGLGKVSSNDATIGVFLGGAGLRFNVFEGDFRPHVSLTLHYLHFLGDGTRHLPLNLGWPIFVGLKPTMGLEWLFYSEMSLLIDGSYGLYVNINEPFRQVLFATAAFALYF
jgi:hypothetical protein